jgi:tetratricopeptide (TPR) repeat protein
MKYIRLFIQVFCPLSLLMLSQVSNSIELIDSRIPAALKNAYDTRYIDPLSCISDINHYKEQKKTLMTGPESEDTTLSFYILPDHLQAFCYAQIDDYSNALNLLQPLLKDTSKSYNEITTLTLIALNIPKEERPQLSNSFLLEKLYKTAENTNIKSINLNITIQLAIAHLSLQIKHYHEAYSALERAKAIILKYKDKQLVPWLDYYYGLYYDLINQPQLAISSFLSANQQADKHALIKLSGQIKQSIAKIYQNKHRFQTALNFTSQQIELYQNTHNTIKQVTSLIEHAVLKRQDNEYNQSIIYLFNALDIIQENENPFLLSYIYLELGRTYLTNKDEKIESLELAQKYLQNARLHFSHLDKPHFQAESLVLLAQLNMINNDPALAILQLEKVLELTKDSELVLRMNAFEMLASNYESTGNLQQAIVHFKNFHTLQNKVKANLFELQQLQISEQLQLLEKTEQQKQLEIQNAELQVSTNRFQLFTYASVTLLIFMSLLFYSALNRNKKLYHAHQAAQLRLSIHPRTKLPFQYVESNHFNYIYHDLPLYYALLNVPFLSQLNELLGTDKAMQIEQKLGQELQNSFSNNIDIFQFRGNQILFITKQQDYKNAGAFAQEIELFFTVFCKKEQLEDAVSCGIVSFPFLNNASRALSPSETLNLSSLALFASSQIRQQNKQSSWVELYAIDNLQPAFLNGDLWELAQIAINKGIIKIHSSHENFQFHWPHFDK